MRRALLLLLALPALLPARALAEDAVELTDGRVLKGRIVAETERMLKIEVPKSSGDGVTVRQVMKSQVKAVVRDGKREVLGEPEVAGPARPVRTREEVEKEIEEVGRTPPDWWAQEKLNYPSTLDLTWPVPAPPPWNNQRHLGQYLWDIVNPNPKQWRAGLKLLAHVMQVNKDREEVVLRAMDSTARLHHDLFEDYARAAFWWRAAAKRRGEEAVSLDLAHCYLELGCLPMAEEILARYPQDGTRNGTVMRLWAEAGQVEKALAMVPEYAKAMPDAAYLAAGDVCRLAGRYDEAVAFYEKIAPLAAGGRDLDRNKKRAEASLEAIRLFETLDVKRVAPGRYRASSLGYEGPVEVEVTVNRGRITAVTVTSHKEKQFYASLTETPRRILEKQSVRGIDCTSGATITSEAIINAAAKALSQGLPRTK